MPNVFLASRSPRRAVLLEQLGVSFLPLPVDVDERRRLNETPADFVCRLALEKAHCGWSMLAATGRGPVLGADTAVVLDRHVFGKPITAAEAESQLEALSGRCHEVLTAVALVAPAESVLLSRSRVWFRELRKEERRRYCATGEPLDKAGSYAIQGLGAIFVARLEGSYSGVMGLPLFETSQLLAAAGMDILPGAECS